MEKFKKAIFICLVLFGQSVSAKPTVDLSWVEPTSREDETVLLSNEIAGYRIYYGDVQRDYHNQIDINSNTDVSYTIEGLTPKTYYIVMTTIDTDGRESVYSTEIAVVVDNSGTLLILLPMTNERIN